MQVEGGVRAGRDSVRVSGAGTLRRSVRFVPLAVLPMLPLFTACGAEDSPPTAGEPLPEGVDTAVRGMRTFITRNGIRRAVVEADTAEWHEADEIHLRQMTLTFFNASGLESTEVTAEFGVFHQLTGDLEAERNVVAEDRVDDQRLETERLRYQNIDGRLYGDTVFHLLRGIEGLTLEGTGFESDPTLDSVLVLNQVGEMRPRVVYSATAPTPADSVGDSTGVVAPPTADEPTAEEPTAEEPISDEPTAEEPVAEEHAAGDSAIAEPDPDALPAQDSAAAADSTAAQPDSVTVPPDSVTVLPDSFPVLPDSLPVLPDSLPVLPDSATAPPHTTAAARR